MEELLVRRDGGTAWVLLNRPERRNAMSLAMWRELRDVVEALGAENDVDVILVRGSGDTFSAGADISEFPRKRWSAGQARAYGAVFDAALDAVATSPKPTVAVIRGFCVGGGLDIACACDLRIAADDARLGVPVARIGVPLGWGELRRLVDLVGRAAALDLLLTGRLVDAPEAERLHLLHRVVPAARLDEAITELVDSLRSGSPLIHRFHKRMLSAALADLATLDPHEAFDSNDFRAGVEAFLARRPPRFRGC